MLMKARKLGSDQDLNFQGRTWSISQKLFYKRAHGRTIRQQIKSELRKMLAINASACLLAGCMGA
jgi:hypothetical protein